MYLSLHSRLGDGLRYRCSSSGFRHVSNSTRVNRCQAAVSFKIQQEVGYGDVLALVGSHESLGTWNVDSAVKLHWNEGHVWTGTVTIPENNEIEFKVVKVTGYGDHVWEEGDNRKLSLNGSKTLDVNLEWGSSSTIGVTAEPKLRRGAGQQEQSVLASEDDTAGSGIEMASSSEDSASERLPHVEWQGKNIEFMKENKHSKERQGVWNADGLSGTMREIVLGDKKSGSWLQKLEVAKQLIVDSSEYMRPGLEILAPVYVYLHWISTGSVQCVEGGGHYRPNRHAELGKIMFRSLEWVIGDAKKTVVEQLVARKMQSRLPSFSEEFTASVPLTRIRDIAHRNDIPHDLKREIKHTLQNKLHRNAGPEDLVACEQMLARITAPGTDYSSAFVSEFRIFMDELRDFFNAGSLTKMLKATTPALDDGGISIIQRFIDAKEVADKKGANATMNDYMDVLHQLTTVRALLVSGLSSGLRNDSPDSAMIMRQRWRLAELRCEEYAFVVLSNVINRLEAAGGAPHLADAHEKTWAQPLGAVVLAVRQCGLSGWKPAECMAIEEEIAAWQQLGISASRLDVNSGVQNDVLRLKATLERCKRLTDDYADTLLRTFAERASKLGAGLGVSSEVQQVFTESEIRANVVFQLSKITTTLLNGTRIMLGAGDFDAIVLGQASGRLVQVDRIEAGQVLADGEPCILLVSEADGDEEITTAGENIRGVILRQELPHLSHLGVRARQERVPFVTCTNSSIISSKLLPLVGSNVSLSAASAAVAVERAAASTLSSNASAGARSPAKASAPVAKKVKKEGVLQLNAAVADTSGAKAAACAELARVSKNAPKGRAFATPSGAVLPFGCMDAAISAAGRAADFEHAVKALDTAEGPALEDACATVQQLVRECPPSDRLIGELQKELAGATVAIARSSANVEDLAGLSGAGLYDSIPNLEVARTDQLSDGITAVWASLFTRRAVLSRRAAGIKQSDASMAVLVQEMLCPDSCFVLHTADPLTDDVSGKDPASLCIELAPGLGETLASGTQGSAWRLSVNKATGAVSMHSFANFSDAYLPRGTTPPTLQAGLNLYSYGSDDETMCQGTVVKRVVDYSKLSLSTDDGARDALAAQLCKVGELLEDVFGGPQDVEGAVVEDRIYIVQSRPQP